MRGFMVSLGLLVGCGGSSLDELGALNVLVKAGNYTEPFELQPAGPYATLFLLSDTECPTIDDGVRATFDGKALELGATGGMQSGYGGPDECEPISFDGTALTAAPGAASTIELVDDTATWTIRAQDFLTADFTLTGTVTAGATITVTWESATSLSPMGYDTYVSILDSSGMTTWTTYAGTSPQTIAGNTITATLPIQVSGNVLAVKAKRMVTTSECTGPASCSIELGADHQFAF